MRRFGLALVAVVGTAGCDLDAIRPKPSAPVQLDSVADATQHYEATRIEFTGTPRPDLVAGHDWQNRPVGRSAGGNTDHAMFVVPVVPEGWTKVDPVPLWISQPGSSTNADAWLATVKDVQNNRVVGKVVDYAGREASAGLGRKESGWQKAIAIAQKKHGIKSDPHAPIVHWPER